MQKMNRKIVYYTLFLSFCGSVILACIFHSQIFSVFIAVWIGGITGLYGYYRIVQMVLRIPSDEQTSKKMGTQEYMKRYLMYGIVLVLCQLIQIPVLGVLAGFMCHKGALLLYALKDKEDLHE